MTQEDALIVGTPSGVVRGLRVGATRQWRGIPYAQPPIGDLRFRAPRPARPWRGVRDATAFGPVAPQRRADPLAGLSRRAVMSEDCLNLNVIAPAEPDARGPLPVLLYLHGGAYSSGAGSNVLYDGSRLVAEGPLVYVSVNYRLGALGWLDFSSHSSRDHVFDGNLGMRDQLLALQWVREHIAAFGGDPDRITIMGESAGGTSVLTLMVTPDARGLFAGAIAQSPAPTSLSSAERHARWSHDFMRLLGTTDPRALREVGAERLVQATHQLVNRATDGEPGRLPLAPVVDGDFLPKGVIAAFDDGDEAPVPLLIGTNRDEATLFQRGFEFVATDENHVERMFGETDPDSADRIRRAYPGYPGDPKQATRIGGDSVFWAPSTAVAAWHSRASDAWMYRYDFATRVMQLVGLGATHASELPAVFGLLDPLLIRSATVGDRRVAAEVSERMRAVWLRFVSEGTASWPRYDADVRRTYVFDRTDRVEADPDAERREAMHRLLLDWSL